VYTFQFRLVNSRCLYLTTLQDESIDLLYIPYLPSQLAFLHVRTFNDEAIVRVYLPNFHGREIFRVYVSCPPVNSRCLFETTLKIEPTDLVKRRSRELRSRENQPVLCTRILAPGVGFGENCVGIRGKYDASVKTLRILRINLVWFTVNGFVVFFLMLKKLCNKFLYKLILDKHDSSSGTKACFGYP
jgi:hypothetical protein